MHRCRKMSRRRSKKRSSRSNRTPQTRDSFIHRGTTKERTMKSAWKVFAILFLATGVVGQTSTAPKARKSKATDATVTAADVQSLKDAIASQQAALAQQQREIQQLRDELHNKDQAAQQAQTAAADAASKADAAQAQASQQQAAVSELKGDVSDLKTSVASTVVTVQEAQKSISGPPTAIRSEE